MFDHEHELFTELNDRLKEKDIDLTIICVGGFVLSHYGLRATHDIDGFFRATREITESIRDVGEKYGINTEEELWLNNSVQNMNIAPDEKICDVLYEFSNLKVLIPPLTYIAGMKMQSAREQDIKDAAAIIRQQKVETPEELKKQLRSYGIDGIDDSIILESFGEAYGMEWLEKYYIENEDKFSF